MSAYIVAQIDIVDRTEYQNYEAGFMEILSKHNGNILSVEEDPRLLEGEWPYTRTVLIEFPTEDEAMTWYTSDDYQSLAQHRYDSSSANIAVIKGLG